MTQSTYGGMFARNDTVPSAQPAQPAQPSYGSQPMSKYGTRPKEDGASPMGGGAGYGYGGGAGYGGGGGYGYGGASSAAPGGAVSNLRGQDTSAYSMSPPVSGMAAPTATAGGYSQPRSMYANLSGSTTASPEQIFAARQNVPGLRPSLGVTTPEMLPGSQPEFPPSTARSYRLPPVGLAGVTVPLSTTQPSEQPSYSPMMGQNDPAGGAANVGIGGGLPGGGMSRYSRRPLY